MEDSRRAYYCRKYAGHLVPALAKVISNSSGLSVQERDQVIRWAADGSLAVTAGAGGGRCWSRALACRIFERDGRKVCSTAWRSRRRRSKVLSCLRSGRLRRRRRVVVDPSRGEKSRMEMLKELVPGGELFKSSSVLLKEAADYILFLEVQVGVLSSLAAGLIDN